MLHCHIDWHLEYGMAVVFADDVPGIPKSVVPTSKHFFPCVSEFRVSSRPPAHTESWDQLCPVWSAYGQL